MAGTMTFGRHVRPVPAALALVAFCPGSLWACSERTGSWWDWERCYCGWRVVVLPLAALAVLGLVCYPFLFLSVYLQRRQPPLWPREAFWRATAWYLFLMTGVAALLFAAASDEWRRTQWRVFPASVAWLDYNWPWIAVLLAGGLAALALGYFTRHKRVATPPGSS
jgi:hypothetical protein